MKADFTEEFERQEKADGLLHLQGKRIIVCDNDFGDLRQVTVEGISANKQAVKVAFAGERRQFEWILVDQFDNRFQFIDDVDAN